MTAEIQINQSPIYKKLSALLMTCDFRVRRSDSPVYNDFAVNKEKIDGA